jgi:hypothetical protein
MAAKLKMPGDGLISGGSGGAMTRVCNPGTLGIPSYNSYS